MGIFNRRNAVLGWLSWIVAKRVVKRKAKDAVSVTAEGSKRPKKGVVATVLAALGGLLWFRRRRRSDEPPPPANE